MIAPAPADSLVRCGGCGRAYSSDAWRALRTHTTLDREDVAPYVVGWPSDCLVEVRACGGCGRSIARTSRRAHPRSR